MNLKWIIHNKIIKSGPFIILVSVLLGIYQIKMFKQYNHVDINLAHYIIYSFGYIENTLDLINVSLWIFPIIFLIYLLGNTVNDFFKKQAVYIFTRTEKRSIWYIKESIHLLLNVILFYIIYFSGNLLIGIMGQLPISTKTDILMIIHVLFIHIFGSYILLLFINLFSFYYQIQYAYLVTLIILFFSIMLSGMILEYFSNFIFIVKWLPSSQFLTSWHDHSFLMALQESMAIHLIEGFSFSFTYGYFLTFYFIIMVISIYKIKNLDIS